MSLHRTFEVNFLYQDIGAQNYLICFRNECSLDKSITGLEANLDWRFEGEIIYQHAISDSLVEITFLEILKVVFDLPLGVACVFLKHYFTKER